MALMAVLILGLAVYFIFRRIKRQKLYERRQVIQRLSFDNSIHRRVADKYPHLTNNQVKQVLDGLKDYFHLSLKAKGMLSMPSQAVDEAWHAFILSTRAYAGFCQRAFGHFLHHHPAETMTTPTQATQGIRRVWKLACLHEGINASRPERLPRLFALDQELNIPQGFYYSLNCMAAGGMAYCASHIGCGGNRGCGGGCSSSSGSNNTSNNDASDSGNDSSSDGSSDSGGCGGGCGGGGD